MITGAGLTWKHGKVHMGTKQYVFKQQCYIALLLDTGLDLFVCFGRTESGVEKISFWFTVLHTRTLLYTETILSLTVVKNTRFGSLTTLLKLYTDRCT